MSSSNINECTIAFPGGSVYVKQWAAETDEGRTPLLVIHGENDEYGSRAFPEFIVNYSAGPAQMRLLESCGHMPYREMPRETIAAVKMFLAEIP